MIYITYYNSVLFAGIGALVHCMIKPVDPKWYEKVEKLEK